MHPRAEAAVPVLELEDLAVSYRTPGGEVQAVRGVSLAVAAGECLAVVGESGAGKSQTFLAVMGLLPPGARVQGRARFAGTELLGCSRAELDRLRGARMAMVFQDPATALTPHVRVGDQIAEVRVRHLGESWSAAREHARRLLASLEVADADRRMREYPHELSGGLRQRALLATALACEPRLLIADEPTTALDTTAQARILGLLAERKRERRMAMILVTHDLGAVAALADRVAVMYAGRVVESGPVRSVLKSPRHPYTRALLRATPRIETPAEAEIPTIPGEPPDPRRLPPGCAFHPRCVVATTICRELAPAPVVRGVVMVACHHPLWPADTAAEEAG